MPTFLVLRLSSLEGPLVLVVRRKKNMDDGLRAIIVSSNI